MVPVRLRGHHFLCILTYRGFGYTPAFVANMSAVVAAISAGRPVELVEGPDAICGGFTAACRSLSDHDCALADTMMMDRMAIEDVRQRVPGVSDGPVVLDAAIVASLRSAFASGAIRSACARCSWSDFCDRIAAEDFSGTRLQPEG